MFKNYKETSWFYIITAVAAFVIMVLVWINLLAPMILPIQEATNGLINRTLMIGIANFILITGTLIRYGKLRWQDFGFARSKIVPAIILIFGLWLLLNLSLVIIALIQGSAVIFADHWRTKGILYVIGLLIGQLFGNALMEEVLYRGFLIPQLYFKLGGDKNKRQSMKLIYAAILSLFIFTIPHLINLENIGVASALVTMIGVFVLGAIIIIFYLHTKNLFLTIGFHALINNATAIFQSSENLPSIIITILGILLLFLWQLLPESLSQNSVEL